jgi:hypothetical protein
VLSGVQCKLLQLGAVLDLYLKTCNDFRKAVENLTKWFQVDNCVAPVGTNEEIHTVVEESRLILAKSQFYLQGWGNTCSYPKDISPTSSVLSLL